MSSVNLPTQYNFRNLTGQKFGRLTVSEYAGNKPTRWSCVCDCGNTVIVHAGNLSSGHSRSCGCFSAEEASVRNSTHGMRNSPEYTSWCSLIGRCENELNESYSDYGGRGITVCDRWRSSFESFYEDMGPRPTPKHSIDRINNDIGYCKENCRWATKLIQNRNRRDTVIVEWKGESKSLREWSEITGIKFHTLYNRIVIKKLDVETAFVAKDRRSERRNSQ